MNKRIWLVIAVLAVAASLVLVAPVGAWEEYQGCTPGYWKQPHHYDSWVTYTEDDMFSDIFGTGPDMTLLEVLQKKGGGAKWALYRHAVAGILNVTSPDVTYKYVVGPDPQTVSSCVEWYKHQHTVIGKVQIAFCEGDFEKWKGFLEAANESYCPLD